MAFQYPVVRVTCDGEECDASMDVPILPADPKRTVEVVHMDANLGGWRIGHARQLCPACDLKLEGD